MRIRSITPILVDAEELERRQARYDRLAPTGWALRLENIPGTPQTPRELATEEQIRASERVGIAAGAETRPAEFEALMPDCVLDPGVTELDARSAVPVLGLTRLSAHFLAACGQRFGVIVRTEAIGVEYRAVIERYGLTHCLDGIHVLGLSVEDVANHEIWNAAIERVAVTAAARGVSVLVNGCSAVEVTIAGGSVRVIDPTALAFRVAELGADLGLIQGTGR